MGKEAFLRKRSYQVFGWALALALVHGYAADASKPTADPGAVGQNAIVAPAKDPGASADCPKHSGSGDCAKAHASGKAGAANMASEGADCPRSAECPKHADCPKGAQCLKHKAHGAKEAKAAPTGDAGAPAAKPADAEKAKPKAG
jgi:hypothetical protein